MAFNVKLARLLTCLILLFKWSTVVLAEPCEDLDTHACELFEKSEPNICQDPVFSQSTCQRYCNLCPLQCYGCDTFDCNTTVTCAPGEKCLKHIVISTLDGQKDILTKCSSIEECDGRLSSVVIGRRQIGKRNHAVTCCSSDLCNDPAATSGSTGAMTESPDTTTGTNVNTSWHNVAQPACDISGGFKLLIDGLTRLCIKLHNHHTDWSHARMTCTRERSDLVVVDSKHKLRMVFNETRGHEFWVGAIGPNSASNYTWVNGHLLTPGSSLWNLGQPNDHQEACVNTLANHPLLHDAPCTESHRFACERSIE